MVGGKRSVVGVDGIECEWSGWRKSQNFGACGDEEMAESIVLGLGYGEIRGVVEAEIAPCGRRFSAIPAGACG